MLLTCHPDKVAYVPSGFDTSAINEAKYRIVSSDVPAPELVDAGCGRSFEVDEDTIEWDTSSDADGNVVERHRSFLCPFCGVLADHVSVREGT